MTSQSDRSRRFVIRLLSGAFVFLAAQFGLFLMFPDPPGVATLDSRGWFLNSGTGVLAVAGLMAAAAGTLAFVDSAEWPRSIMPFAAGAAATMIVTLLVIGPGDLFPIVIAVGAATIGAAATIGSVVGHWLWNRQRARPVS